MKTKHQKTIKPTCWGIFSKMQPMKQTNSQHSCSLVHPSFLGVPANGKSNRNSHSLDAWVFSTPSSRHPNRNSFLVNSPH